MGIGAVVGDHIMEVSTAIDVFLNATRYSFLNQFKASPNVTRRLSSRPVPVDMLELLRHGESWRQALSSAVTNLAATPKKSLPPGLLFPLNRVRLLAPVPRPGKITCVGLNYSDHALEVGMKLPASPIFFLKSANTICGPNEPIVLPANSTQVDYEAELAVVIGKKGRDIPENKAYEYISGYTIMNDVSARDMQFNDQQWFRGKSCDTFAPMGPWLVTPDEIPDPHQLCISLDLNGQQMQHSNTSKLIFTVPRLISFLSQSLTWEVGDLILTGTPPGVGFSRNPPVFVKSGDRIAVHIEKIGSLCNPVSGR